MELYPLKFRAIFKERIWGGENLRTFFGKELPGGKKIGESRDIVHPPIAKPVSSSDVEDYDFRILKLIFLDKVYNFFFFRLCCIRDKKWRDRINIYSNGFD